MADELIPVDVRDFILTYIESVAQLEALLLLLHKPTEKWAASSVAAQLYIDEEQAKGVLERLCDSGLADCSEATFWFDAGPPGQRELVERLADLYSRHLIPVTKLIHSRPSGIRAFAAAFKFRKDR